MTEHEHDWVDTQTDRWDMPLEQHCAYCNIYRWCKKNPTKSPWHWGRRPDNAIEYPE